MYKLGFLPSITDDISSLADFIEIECLFSEEKTFSIESAKSALSVESDELHFEGIDDDDDRTYNRLMEVFAELSQRKKDCGGSYPFNVDKDGLLIFDDNCDKQISEIYKFLLFATRANMRDNRHFGKGKDAALLFELLSKYICEAYFGDKSTAMVFGTASGMTFKEKVKKLIERLHYNSEVRLPVGSTGMEKDATLDVIVWNHFEDKRDSMLIGMAQCKTGTHWEGLLTQLMPTTFFRNYISYQPITDPIRLFFITESVALKEQWEDRARKAGILFDRRRIMSLLSQKIDNSLMKDIIDWNTSIIRLYNL